LDVDKHLNVTGEILAVLIGGHQEQKELLNPKDFSAFLIGL
jgi:hypothetical protein